MSSEMTEFRITSDLSVLRGAVIDANFDEVRDWLDTNLAPYRDLAVTPDTMSTAKQYRANIRKVRDRIDESRKEAKNAALAAYSAFETKCKELTGLCDDAANAIDSQVKALEEEEAQRKIDALHSEYIALSDDEVETYCPWGSINNPKWANKGYSAETALEEIRNAIQNTRDDLASIRGMGGDDTPYLLDVYRQTRNISAVVRKASELKTMRQREELRAREEAERAERAAKTSAAPAPVTEKAEQPAQEEFVTVSFKVTCTKAQLTALGQYMKQNGIRYGRA